MKIRGLDFLKHFSNINTTWRQIAALVVCFLLFIGILSSGLFISKLNLELGDPSPQLVTAPYEKNIEDLDGYYEDQEAAAKAVEPVFKPDESHLTSIARDLSTAFMALEEGITGNEDQASRLNTIRKIVPFDALSQDVLLRLMSTSADLLDEKEQRATEIINGNARNDESGARSKEETSALRQQMKRDIDNAPFPDEYKLFLSEFVDAKITQPTLIEDSETTESLRQNARASVRLDVHRYKAQQKIVGPGEIVDEEIMQVLAAYGLVENRSPWRSVAGIALIVIASMGTLLFYAYQYRRQVDRLAKKLVLIALMMLLVLAMGKGVIALNLGEAEYSALAGILIPVAWATMTIAILVDVEIAYFSAAILSVFVGLLADPSISTTTGWQISLVALFGGLVGVHSVSLLSQRVDLARAGIYIAAVNVITVSGIAMVSGMRIATWLISVGLGLVNGVFASVLAVGTLHWFESGFGITSAIRLLELSNPNRPLLKRLLMEAPGTYHHSILVGNLAEAAAEEVQANAILVRVGALYHDIGKLKRPYFFIENQFAQDNPHDKIAPTLSALIITSHLKDGLEMAKEEKLPQVIQDIIAQHHGDSVVSFFYHKALEDNASIPEEAFHYEGPKPQTKEAALVLLADSVEAAVRAMKQPTPGRIEGLVRKIIKDKLNDDQLSQCNLTFQDLDKIATSFVRILSGIFHSRVEYPELQPKQELESAMLLGEGEDTDEIDLERTGSDKADSETVDSETAHSEQTETPVTDNTIAQDSFDQDESGAKNHS
ncbi:putative domain HDIG-containing protein [Desulfitobacterium dichloroeliminans LMG P-21439]|uniref:Putative domain HDIG-containing protein n=1 Tax=Desulfitobacterium dichloroeliminans (strain LMG P-21439 / DCA1) TaxID=871963 RepID=L0FBS3_DESDL|nr:HDIG domain-containing metalloprotein [Desulfitobacterium dichloroeliminans]AGA70398.1 putative domain HDIG-containing protein [Desulfitobacterium dichloroeliminans LMG P-21439]